MQQIECNSSSEHKIDHKVKGVNEGNEKTQKGEKILSKMTGKQKMKRRNVILKSMTIAGMM